MDLNTLQIALINNDLSGVRAVIDDLDRKTENEAFRRAGEHFGFPTAEWFGMRVAYQGDLSPIFGYSDASGLRRLASRFDLPMLNLDWFGKSALPKIREQFSLEVKTSRATFFTWSTFLLSGMLSTAVASDKVKLYLLECERASRMGGLGSSEKHQREARQDSFRRAATIARIDGMKNPVLQRLALEEIGIDSAVLGQQDIQQDLFR